jgi:DNA-binding MarR family transcriptional regulator
VDATDSRQPDAAGSDDGGPVDARPDTSVSEGPWLDQDEQRTWLHVVQLMMRLPAALDHQLQHDNGLSLFEYLVLSILSMSPDRRVRLSRLSAASGSTATRMSNVMKKFESHGLARREQDERDRRVIWAVLCEPGWRAVVAAAPGHVAEVRRLVIDPLTREQQTGLIETLQPLLLAIDPTLTDPAAALADLPHDSGSA